MKNKIVLGGLMISLLLSCNDNEFLREDPKTFYTLDNVFTTPAQVEQSIASLYYYERYLENFITGGIRNAGFFWKGNGTDVLENIYGSMGSSMDNYGVFNPQNSTISSLWDYFYLIISKANLVIYAANQPQISWSSESDKKYAIAQGRFFKAWAYCNLAELWGGVPIITEYLDTPKLDFKRETAVATYQYAIDELLAIENDLPETITQGGKIVKGVAQHFLCELYLGLGIQLKEEGKATEAQTAYANSIGYGNKVINGGVYSLMTSRFGTRKNESVVTIDVYKKGVFKTSEKVDTIRLIPNHYWDLFQEGNQNYQDGNKECIWAIQVDYNAFKAEDSQSVLAYARHYGPDMTTGTSSKHIISMLEEVAGRGIATNIPTFYWRDIIWEGKWRTDIRNSESVIRRRFKANVPTSPYYLQVVPWSVLYNLSDAIWQRWVSYCYPVSCKIATDKFTGVADGQNRSNLFRDDYIVRLPETILLRAEAKQRNGDKAGAAADINLLRSRAQCSYLVTTADMDDDFNMILDERARELIYEEQRWNTLLRMRGTIAVDRVKKYMLWDENRATLTRTFNMLPIPQSVIDANYGNKIEQNPGWD